LRLHWTNQASLNQSSLLVKITFNNNHEHSLHSRQFFTVFAGKEILPAAKLGVFELTCSLVNGKKYRFVF
jgi:hypothetical protein